jgi:hypothetical protein
MLYNYSEFINEYKKIDLEPNRNSDETYHGPLFIHSEEPLTLEEVKKMKSIKAKFHNKLDACDIDSEYIYKINTKHPIVNRNMEFNLKDTVKDASINPVPPKGDEEEEPSSGTFSSFWSSMSQEAVIKTDDITYFKRIGGFCSYDKEKVKRQDRKLKEETEEFVSSFIQGATLHHETLTDEIIEDLKWTRPDKPIKVYKGIEEVQIRFLLNSPEPPYKKGQTITAKWTGPASWTVNPMIGRAFIDDYPSSQPFLIEMIVEPDQVLMDTRKLSKLYYHTDQREITLLPGTYTFKIVWAGD